MKKITAAITTLALTVSTSVLADDFDKGVGVLALQSGSATFNDIATDIHQRVDGVIVEAEFDDFDNEYGYELKVIDLDSDNEYEFSYAISDGRLVAEETESLTTFGFSDIEDKERTAIQTVLSSNFNIVTAVSDLENKYNAKLVEFELENKKGIVFYEVKLFNLESGKQSLLVNVENGQEIPVINYKKAKKHQNDK